MGETVVVLVIAGAFSSSEELAYYDEESYACFFPTIFMTGIAYFSSLFGGSLLANGSSFLD